MMNRLDMIITRERAFRLHDLAFAVMLAVAMMLVAFAAVTSGYR